MFKGDRRLGRLFLVAVAEGKAIRRSGSSAPGRAGPRTANIRLQPTERIAACHRLILSSAPTLVQAAGQAVAGILRPAKIAPVGERYEVLVHLTW